MRTRTWQVLRVIGGLSVTIIALAALEVVANLFGLNTGLLTGGAVMVAVPCAVVAYTLAYIVNPKPSSGAQT